VSDIGDPTVEVGKRRRGLDFRIFGFGLQKQFPISTILLYEKKKKKRLNLSSSLRKKKKNLYIYFFILTKKIMMPLHFTKSFIIDVKAFLFNFCIFSKYLKSK